MTMTGLVFKNYYVFSLEKINECVEIANATFKLAEWLVSVGLAQEVDQKIRDLVR